MKDIIEITLNLFSKRFPYNIMLVIEGQNSLTYRKVVGTLVITNIKNIKYFKIFLDDSYKVFYHSL